MCVSVSLGVHVQFSDTILYVAEFPGRGRLKNRVIHVLGYENTVQNDLNDTGHSGNAMLLPLPAIPGTMTRKNCILTQHCPHILQDYVLEIKRQLRTSCATLDVPLKKSASNSVEVFNSGIYTVILAQNATEIPSALEKVPPEKRPSLHSELFETYSKWYPNWTFALCCFNNKQASRATPLFWWYEPIEPNQLFAPGVDCHTGSIPNLKQDVQVSHTLVAGSYWMESNHKESHYPEKVRFRDKIRWGVNPYLSRQVVGAQYSGFLPNGDFIIPFEKVRSISESAGGLLPFARVKPPGT